MKKPYFIKGLLIALVIIVLDQWSKLQMLAYLREQSGPVPITGFFNLTIVWNRGISFGMFNNAGHDYAPLLLSAMALVITVCVLVWLWKVQHWLLASALGLVAGGAIGNVIDRARYGAVFDFLDLYVKDYHWPAFNLADSAIAVGVAILCYDSIFHKNTEAG